MSSGSGGAADIPRSHHRRERDANLQIYPTAGAHGDRRSAGHARVGSRWSDRVQAPRRRQPGDSLLKEILYCGISDKGRTDAFLGRPLGKAEEMVVRNLRRRLRELFPGDPVNIRPLLYKVREKFQVWIRWMLERALKEVCKAVLEISAAAVLEQL